MTENDQVVRFMVELRRENARRLGITLEELENADLHELEESVGLDDADLLPPPRTTRGGSPTSALYCRETKAQRDARRARIDKLVRKFKVPAQ